MNKDIAINHKCNVCKCYWKPDETDIKSNGKIYKSCKKCREKQTNAAIRKFNRTMHNLRTGDNDDDIDIIMDNIYKKFIMKK